MKRFKHVVYLMSIVFLISGGKVNLLAKETIETNKAQNITETNVLELIVLENGMKYQGQLKDNKPHGYGVLYEANNVMRIGEFKNGKADGYSFFINQDGSSYLGQVKDGKAEGYGYIGFKDTEERIVQGEKALSLEYFGQMKDGKAHGYGVEGMRGDCIVGLKYFDVVYKEGKLKPESIGIPNLSHGGVYLKLSSKQEPMNIDGTTSLTGYMSVPSVWYRDLTDGTKDPFFVGKAIGENGMLTKKSEFTLLEGIRFGENGIITIGNWTDNILQRGCIIGGGEIYIGEVNPDQTFKQGVYIINDKDGNEEIILIEE